MTTNTTTYMSDVTVVVLVVVWLQKKKSVQDLIPEVLRGTFVTFSPLKKKKRSKQKQR